MFNLRNSFILIVGFAMVFSSTDAFARARGRVRTSFDRTATVKEFFDRTSRSDQRARVMEALRERNPEFANKMGALSKELDLARKSGNAMSEKAVLDRIKALEMDQYADTVAKILKGAETNADGMSDFSSLFAKKNASTADSMNETAGPKGKDHWRSAFSSVVGENRQAMDLLMEGVDGLYATGESNPARLAKMEQALFGKLANVLEGMDKDSVDTAIAKSADDLITHRSSRRRRGRAQATKEGNPFSEVMAEVAGIEMRFGGKGKEKFIEALLESANDPIALKALGNMLAVYKKGYAQAKEAGKSDKEAHNMAVAAVNDRFVGKDKNITKAERNTFCKNCPGRGLMCFPKGLALVL